MPVEDVDLQPTADRIPGTLWHVVSDRDNNQTFEKPDGLTPKKRLSFLEGDLYVLEDEGDFVHIFKDTEISFDGKLTASAIDFGWISKLKLLMWNHCLVTSKGEINKKAMVLNTVESIKSNATSGDGKKIQFSRDPELSINSKNESQLFQVFFVYKINAINNTVLLGKNSSIRDVSYITDNIVGWVEISRITSWDHRIAIEPNWLPEAVAERKAKNVKAMVFKSSSDAITFNVSKAFWDADPYEDRNIGDWRRFPVLDSNQGIIYTGVMGEINSVKGVKLTSEDNAVIQRTYNEIRASKRNINFVFLVNAAHEEMKNSIEAINDALDEVNKHMEEINTKNNISYAVVAYRDQDFGANITSIMPFSTDVSEVRKFIRGIDISSKYGSDDGDAMLFGLKAALRQVGWGPNAKDESNVIIHIGGHGNHKRQDESQVDVNAVIELLDQMNCQYYVFQGYRKPSATFNEFLEMNSDIMLTVARRKFSRYKNAPGSDAVSLQEPEFKTYDTFKALNNIAIAGKVDFLQNRDVVDADELQRNIRGIALFTNSYVDFFLRIMDRIMMDGQGINSAMLSSGSSSETAQETGTAFTSNTTKSSSAMVSSYAPAIMYFLSEMNLPEEKLDVIIDEHYQLYFPGFTKLTVDGLVHPIFNSVLFLTRKELSRMLIKFETLLNAVSASDQRQKMVEAWIELLKKHTGGTEDEFMDLTMEDINQKIFGLPGTSNLLTVKLKNITDPAIVDDRTFQAYVGQVQRKQRALNKIFNKDNYEYSFSSNDQKYYWIAEDLLP